MRILKRFWYRLLKKGPGDFEMVHYWKSKEFVEAKLTTKNGAKVMYLQGEKYPIWGFPRGHLLVPLNPDFKGEAASLDERIQKYGPFSVLKHEVKQVFNEISRKVDEKLPFEQIAKEGKDQLFEALGVMDHLKFDLMPSETMCPAVREIHRAWTKVAPSERSFKVRNFSCLLFQEDDGYRYRVQWMAIWFPLLKWFKNPIKVLDRGLAMVERAEVIGDMKRKIKLLRKGLAIALQDKNIRDLFTKFFKEVNWKKVRLTKGDRYHFRGKYFKVDLDVIEY